MQDIQSSSLNGLWKVRHILEIHYLGIYFKEKTGQTKTNLRRKLDKTARMCFMIIMIMIVKTVNNLNIHSLEIHI